MEDIRPGILNIDLLQNESYEETWEFTDDISGDPFDISTSSDIIMEVKEDFRLHSIFKLTIGNGLTVIGTNQLKVLIHYSNTRKLSRPRYVFDVLFNLESGIKPSYLLRGQINVTRTISRI